MGANEYYSRLVTSLDKFRETNFLCDTILVTDDKRELKAHSVVLAAASSVFRTAFASAAERGPGPLQVNLREYESDIVEIALQFIYTGKLLLIPAVFEQKSEWSRLVGVLERLGLDMHLVDQCEKSFKDAVIIKEEDVLEEKSQNEEDTCREGLDCGDVSPKPHEQGRAMNSSRSRTRHNSKPVKRPVRRPKRNVRTSGSDRHPVEKVSAENESETDRLPNGNLLPESDLLTTDEAGVARTGGKTSLDPSARLFVCEACGRSFTKKERLILHERTHTGERPFECETCGRRFSLAGNLRRHLPLHSGQKPFMCELCGRTFIRRTYLEDHLAVHVTAHPYACSLCPKRFNSGGQLRLHFRYVHDRSSGAAANRKWYPCEVCNKNFSSKGNLRTHLRTHTGERPFVCACGKAYAQRIQLVQHSRLHSDERPFSCEMCGRSFRFRSSYLIHNRTHTGERPHVCEHCGKSYTNKAGLRTHTSRVHAVKNDEVSVIEPLVYI